MNIPHVQEVTDDAQAYYRLNQNSAYSTSYWEIWKSRDICSFFVISHWCILRTQILCSPNIQWLQVYGFIGRIAYYIIKDSTKSALLWSREYVTTPCSAPGLLWFEAAKLPVKDFILKIYISGIRLIIQPPEPSGFQKENIKGLR